MKQILAISKSLIFKSKIREAARACGREVVFMKGLDELAAVPAGEEVLLDLESLPEGALGGAGTGSGGESTPRLLERHKVIAFGSHVHHEKMEAAKLAGARAVYPNSKFFNVLPELLQG